MGIHYCKNVSLRDYFCFLCFGFTSCLPVPQTMSFLQSIRDDPTTFSAKSFISDYLKWFPKFQCRQYFRVLSFAFIYLCLNLTIVTENSLKSSAFISHAVMWFWHLTPHLGLFMSLLKSIYLNSFTKSFSHIWMMLFLNFLCNMSQ